jgi:DeoR/GlpR family transcriptional regulator of sugar metabolism
MPSRRAAEPSFRRRRQELLTLLAQRGELTVAEACARFDASEATVRRDFRRLVREGGASKTWGGLRLAGSASGLSMAPFAERDQQAAAAKDAIARSAASLVRDGEVIIVDGGTTTLRLAPWLARRRVRILTHSLAIAHAIDQARDGRTGAEVFVTGGRLYPESSMLVGPRARATLRAYRADWAFLSCSGWDGETVTNHNEQIVEVEQAMIAQAAQVALLADASKRGAAGMTPICTWRDIDVLVTERRPPAPMCAALRRAKVRLLLAKPGATHA